MIISEKQIWSLIRIAEAYCNELYKLNEYKSFQEIQIILLDIVNQQSEKLIEVKNE